MQVPDLKSPSETLEGIVYIPRLLSKIRLHAAGKLPAEYHANLGIGFDGRCCSFLGIEYPALVEQVKAGADDAAALQWAFTQGRKPTEEQVEVWNGFMTKRGWKDEATPMLMKRKQENGHQDRADIETFFQYLDLDEERAPQG